MTAFESTPNFLIIGTRGGYVYLLDPRSKKIVQNVHFEHGVSAIVVDEGHQKESIVYVGTNVGAIIQFTVLNQSRRIMIDSAACLLLPFDVPVRKFVWDPYQRGKGVLLCWSCFVFVSA